MILGVISAHFSQNQTFDGKIRPFLDLYVQKGPILDQIPKKSDHLGTLLYWTSYDGLLFYGLYRTILDYTGLSWTREDFAGILILYRTLSYNTGGYLTACDNTGQYEVFILYQTIQD